VAAEAKIAEQELFIQQVADASPTILYNFNCIENCIDYINKEIYFVLGYTVEEVIAMNKDVVKNLYHPEDYSLLPERAESDRKFQHRNSMIQYECRVKSKEGEWKWVLVREVVFKSDKAGSPIQILGAALDITQRKDMERSLLQNSFQLEQSNASLEEFAYVASHDLKEPLRKISTFGDRVLTTQDQNMTDEGKVYMNKVVDASQRMQVMINDLLSISMITGDRNFIKYSLQSILEDAKQTLEYKIEQVNAIIDAEALPEANIIPSQFRQLFQNLLSNSLKFIPDGRQPVIKIRSQHLTTEEAAEQQLTKASSYLKLQFSDNGIGFEEEYAGRIFQIFQRLHGRSEYEGTGIGLAICKKIVEHHGGIIYASSKLNVGAVFTIIIPT
jgi:PAS domain S-box-containing protein